MIKNIFISILFIIFTYQGAFAQYNMSTPLEGESIANDTLQFIVVKDIYKQIQTKYPACFDYKVTDTQIIHYPYDVKKKKGEYVKGYWKELWTINCCNNKVQIPITFFIHKNKTTYNMELPK